MYVERKSDLSLHYFLVDLFSDASYVNIVDGFPQGDLVIPTVSVETDTIDTEILEIGSTNRIQHRIWYIDIFAKTKSQRDDFGYRIINALKVNLPVYDYDEGFPPDVSPSQLGSFEPDSIRLKVISIQPELVSTMYYRARVTYLATYDKI